MLAAFPCLPFVWKAGGLDAGVQSEVETGLAVVADPKGFPGMRALHLFAGLPDSHSRNFIMKIRVTADGIVSKLIK
jgi:hypothetical protein